VLARISRLREFLAGLVKNDWRASLAGGAESFALRRTLKQFSTCRECAHELPSTIPDVKMLLAPEDSDGRAVRMARAEPPRAMESVADIKSFKAHGAIVAVL